MMKNQLSSFIYEFARTVPKETIYDLLEIPPQKEMGDYALPCFQLAKRLHKSPVVIAGELKNALEKAHHPDIERVEAMNGYLNLWLKKENYSNKGSHKGVFAIKILKTYYNEFKYKNSYRDPIDFIRGNK